MIQKFIFTQPLKYFEIEEKGVKRFFIKGDFSTTDKDLVNDICTKNCLSSMVKQIKDGRIKLDFEHESFRGDTELDKEIAKTRLPVAKAIDAKVSGEAAEATWELNPDYKKFDDKGKVTMDSKDVIKNIKSEMLDSFSIAYIPTKSKEVTKDGETIRLLDDVRLLNIALTGNPINTSAQIHKVFMKSLNAMDQYKVDEKSDPTIKEKVEVKTRDAQGRNTAKPKEDEDEDEDEEETKKKKYKAYEKDGAHAHTELEPLGIHNHPEIEDRINRSIDFLHERISRLQESLPDQTEGSSEVFAAKDLTGTWTFTSHSHENNNYKEVKTMTTEKKDEVTKEDEETTEESKEEPAKEATPTDESSSEPVSEIKTLLAEQNAKIDSMAEEIKTLKAEKVESVGKSKALMSNKSQTEVKAVAGMGELS